jgi:hypothetical protein
MFAQAALANIFVAKANAYQVSFLITILIF